MRIRDLLRIFVVVGILAVGIRSEASNVLAQSAFHNVASGETWESIALTYGVEVKSLQQSNGVINPSLLAEDQRL